MSPTSIPPAPATRLVAALLVGLGLPPVQAKPTADSVPFDIPAQPLNQALLAFGKQSGRQLLYRTDIADNLQSRELKGDHPPEEAVRILLADAPIQAVDTDNGALTLESRKKTAPQSQSPVDATALPAVVVTGQAPDDPRNRRYNVPDASTATKTDTPIMETPASIRVVPRAVMDDQKTSRITDALENISGVRPQSSLGTSTGFIVRGFRIPTVYRNSLLPLPGAFRTEFDTANLESIEVLKGPAAMLFGRTEPGGLINVITKKPLDTPYYSLEQRFGSYGFYRTEWDAAGPATADGSLLYRFTGGYQNSQSFRDFVSNDRILVYPSITWRPTDDTDITFNVEGFNQDFQADYGIPVVGKRPANIPISRSFGDPNDPKDNVWKTLVGSEVNHRFNQDWAIHNRFLASFGGAQETFLNPAPAFGNALNPNTGILQRNVFSQENDYQSYATNLDVTGKFDIYQTKHNILLGFDYLRAFTNYRWNGFFDTANPDLAINIYNPWPSYGIPQRVFRETLRDSEFPGSNYSAYKDEWFGLYFQDQITLWDKLHILGGGRYNWVETGRGNGGSWGEADNKLSGRLRKDEGFSPRVGILYNPWQWFSIYGNWTTSFGANNGIDAVGNTFDPQIGEQFEAGIKTQLFDDRLIATLAYYHITKDNILTPDLSTPDPTDKRAIGEERSQGFEMDVSGKITDSLSMIGSYAYTDARITKDNSGNQGHRLTNVPENSGSLWLRYDIHEYAPLEGLSLGIGGVATGQREGDYGNTFQMPGYVRMDLFAAYKVDVQKTKVTAQINIRNVLNKRYFESTDPDANVSPNNGVYPGAPLMAIGSIRVEY